MGGQKNIVTLEKRSARFRRDRPGSVERWCLSAVFERTTRRETMQVLQMKYRFHSLFIAFFHSKHVTLIGCAIKNPPIQSNYQETNREAKRR